MILWMWTLPTEAKGQRADVAIHEAIRSGQGSWTGTDKPVECSRSRIQKLMEDGLVTSEGQPVVARARLAAGTVVRVEVPPPRPTDLVPENRPLEILFEDAHLVVVNKPPGLTVHPSETQFEGTLVQALLHHIKDLSGIGGALRPGIVHRIDKNTSGALVITKTDTAHIRLAEVFAKHEIERSYWALCYGTPEPPQGRIESLIGRNPQDRKKMSMDVKEGRRAVTHYKRLREFSQPRAKPFASWIEATLETGRTHQVRVHLTGLGHSLLGDSAYGAPSERHSKWLALPANVRELVGRLPGQALHARVLGFDHPITGEKLRFEAPPPPAFATLLEALQSFAGF